MDPSSFCATEKSSQTAQKQKILIAAISATSSASWAKLAPRRLVLSLLTYRLPLSGTPSSIRPLVPVVLPRVRLSKNPSYQRSWSP
jgi:hypothetical protein